MSTNLSIYSVACLTEGIRVGTDYRSTVPTTCPNNNTHIIDPAQTQIIGTINSKIVTIDQSSSVTTNGHFRADPYKFTALPGVNTFDIVYPYNISIFNTVLRFTADNIGDYIEVVSRPNTIVGLIMNAVNPGDTSVTIASVAQLSVGFLLRITDGVNTEELGEIVNVDYTLGILTFTNPLVKAYAIGTPVDITLQGMRPYEIIKEENLDVGIGKIKAVGQPAGKISRIKYTNNGLVNKSVSLLAQLYY